MTTAIWAMPGGRQVGLVVEDAAEVLAIREDVGLQRQVRAARVDQVDARQPVLGRDLLQPQVLLDRHREVGAALDGGVVGDDGDLATADDADAGDDPGAGRLAVVHVPGGERRELEERRPGIDEAVDAVAGQQLAAARCAARRPRRRRPRWTSASRSRSSATSARLASRLASNEAARGESARMVIEPLASGIGRVSRGQPRRVAGGRRRWQGQRLLEPLPDRVGIVEALLPRLLTTMTVRNIQATTASATRASGSRFHRRKSATSTVRPAAGSASAVGAVIDPRSTLPSAVSSTARELEGRRIPSARRPVSSRHQVKDTRDPSSAAVDEHHPRGAATGAGPVTREQRLEDRARLIDRPRRVDDQRPA